MATGTVVDMARMGRALSEARFEWSLRQLPQSKIGVAFDLSNCSFISIGLSIRFLSLLNQLDHDNPGFVEVRFGKNKELFAHLDRSGFFSYLSVTVVTHPERPPVSAYLTGRHNSPGFAEICCFDPQFEAETKRKAVKELSSGFELACDFHKVDQELQGPVFTILRELSENVFIHSGTRLAGFASLQLYPDAKRTRVEVAVSDSGLGIPETIRTAIRGRIANKSDAYIVLEAFRQGLSRMGKDSGRGCGLVMCAQLAAQYRSDLIVRTPQALVRLRPWAFGNNHEAHVTQDVWECRGTHVSFVFRLTDNGLGH